MRGHAMRAGLRLLHAEKGLKACRRPLEAARTAFRERGLRYEPGYDCLAL